MIACDVVSFVAYRNFGNDFTRHHSASRVASSASGILSCLFAPIIASELSSRRRQRIGVCARTNAEQRAPHVDARTALHERRASCVSLRRRRGRFEESGSLAAAIFVRGRRLRRALADTASSRVPVVDVLSASFVVANSLPQPLFMSARLRRFRRRTESSSRRGSCVLLLACRARLPPSLRSLRSFDPRACAQSYPLPSFVRSAHAHNHHAFVISPVAAPSSRPHVRVLCCVSCVALSTDVCADDQRCDRGVGAQFGSKRAAPCESTALLRAVAVALRQLAFAAALLTCPSCHPRRGVTRRVAAAARDPVAPATPRLRRTTSERLLATCLRSRLEPSCEGVFVLLFRFLPTSGTTAHAITPSQFIRFKRHGMVRLPSSTHVAQRNNGTHIPKCQLPATAPPPNRSS
jgi:hypothetical protein